MVEVDERLKHIVVEQGVHTVEVLVFQERFG